MWPLWQAIRSRYPFFYRWYWTKWIVIYGMLLCAYASSSFGDLDLWASEKWKGKSICMWHFLFNMDHVSSSFHANSRVESFLDWECIFLVNTPKCKELKLLKAWVLDIAYCLAWACQRKFQGTDVDALIERVWRVFIVNTGCLCLKESNRGLSQMCCNS